MNGDTPRPGGAVLIVACPVHGDLVVDVAKAALFLGTNNDSHYTFPCGQCGDRVTRPASAKTLTLLGDLVTAHLIDTNLDEELRRLLT